jgi:hypothetical protein
MTTSLPSQLSEVWTALITSTVVTVTVTVVVTVAAARVEPCETLFQAERQTHVEITLSRARDKLGTCHRVIEATPLKVLQICY